MAKDPIFTISDLRGGINNSDSPTLLAPNQIIDARNVDFRDGALGAKRRGTTPISLSGSAFNTDVIALIRHTPTNDSADDELWGIDANGNIDRRVGGVWQGGVTRVNTSVVITTQQRRANGVSLHGKLFIAAKGTQDRLLVWDGNVLRWAGIAQPAAPGVAETAVAGSYVETRHFRIRYTQQVSGATVRRSEPSTAVTLVPTGTKNGAIITKPAGTENPATVNMEGQTHWEVEASVDGVLFYRIATVAIGTATYTDTNPSADYHTFPLSETIGEYVPPGAAEVVAVDEDRLLLAGNHFADGLGAYVWWTPVSADDGVGNDERLPTATSQYIVFDGLDGGKVVAMVTGVNGNSYVFKATRVYKMVRTGILTQAYVPVTVTQARGALPLAAVAGMDAEDVPCVYFLDPSVGLCILGRQGLVNVGVHVRDTWLTRTLSGAIDPKIVYCPELEQVWYSVCLAGSVSPNRLFMFECRYGANMFHDGVPATAVAFAQFPVNGAVKPFLSTGATVQQADTGVADNGVNFRGYVTTKPYMLGALWQKFGIMAAVLLARAAPSTLTLAMIRNFGIQAPAAKTVSLAVVGTESHVVRPIDNASLSELNTLQIEYGDAAASAQEWSIDHMVFRLREEESSC